MSILLFLKHQLAAMRSSVDWRQNNGTSKRLASASLCVVVRPLDPKRYAEEGLSFPTFGEQDT
jgi:hypothetical protein